MNTIKVFKALLLISMLSLVAGCKLALMVSSGGDVTSLSQTRDCAGGTICEFEINDATFNETFTAVPSVGYVFASWEEGVAGGRFQCAGSTDPVCVIDNTGLAGNATYEPLIEGESIYYLLPRFEYTGIDTDGDGTPDHQDPDDDNDGVLDDDDNCPQVGPNEDGFGCPDVNNIVDFDGTTEEVLGEQFSYIIDDGFKWETDSFDGGRISYEPGAPGEGNALRLETTQSCLFGGPVEECDPDFISDRGYWSLKRAQAGARFTLVSFDVLQTSGDMNLRSWRNGSGWVTLNEHITTPGHYEFGPGTPFEDIDEFLIATYNGVTALIDNIVIAPVPE